MSHMDTDRIAYENFLYSPTGPIMSAFRDVGNEVRNVAIRNTRRDTGRLAASYIVTQRRDGDNIRTSVGSELDYAIYQELGTGLYGPTGEPIRPRNATVLRFKPGRKKGPSRRGQRGSSPERRGPWVFAAEVKGAPGTRALSEALHRVLPRARIVYYYM